MNHEEYEKLHRFESFYWWHVGRRYLVKSFLGRYKRKKKGKILEIGCGTGGNLEVLSEWGKVTGLDVSPKALNFCRKKGFQELILGSAERMNFPDRSFDLIVALDVLEHVEDDKEALKGCWRILERGGLFLASVPAYKFLWSEHDEVLGHFRRYSSKEFKKKLKEAGFEEIKASYLVTFVFPLVLSYRLFRKVFFPRSRNNLAYVVLPKILNSFFISLLKIETHLIKYINLPFGTSIVCLYRKPEKE